MPPSPPWLPVPLDRPVYTGLLTDHYPWTEVTADLAVRQGQGLSGVFDARQGPRRARFVWVRGALRGGFTPGTSGTAEVSWAAMMAALPRASVTLAAVEPAVAEAAWACREGAATPLAGAWPETRPALERALFSGALLSGGACSFWEAGRPVGGSLPAVGAACATVAPPSRGGTTLAGFWSDLIAAVHALQPLDGPWRAACVHLTPQHPCLDPFVREVVVQGGRLHLDPDVPAAEWRPALLAALGSTLTQLNLRLADLPLAELRARPDWNASGLEGL